MRETPEEFENDDNPEEGYPVAPLPSDLHKPRPVVKTWFEQEVDKKVKQGMERNRKKPFQYSLADIFTLTTMVAVFLSILSLMSRGLPQRQRPPQRG